MHAIDSITHAWDKTWTTTYRDIKPNTCRSLDHVLNSAEVRPDASADEIPAVPWQNDILGSHLHLVRFLQDTEVIGAEPDGKRRTLENTLDSNMRSTIQAAFLTDSWSVRMISIRPRR
ncbi:uncharacterized protein PG986_013084 [Apiospora aurea]|uniref:Uncharacterized protein n=1 Tax=Apiospora aurea TaxID=335848 RepID=A0ABR1Q312_9PEZI